MADEINEFEEVVTSEKTADSSSKDCRIFERLNSYMHIIQRKRDLLKEAVTKETMKECTFHPLTQSRGERLPKENSDVHLRLFKQASIPRKLPTVQSKTKLINKSSEQLLIKKFKSEFTSLVSDTELTYPEYISVLTKMGFLKTEHELALEAWESLTSDTQALSAKHFLKFLLSLIKKPTPKFSQFRANRQLNSLHSFTSKLATDAECSFKPNISKKSTRLANTRKKGRTKDFLFKEAQMLRLKKARMWIDKEIKEFDSPLSPVKTVAQHRGLALYELSKVIAQKMKEKREDEWIRKMTLE